jgi:radical SAM protein with 4Fe4S-binding SPASM domain
MSETASAAPVHSQSLPIEEVRALLAGNPVLGLGDSAEGVWRMRPDVRRIILYRISHDTSEIERMIRIHPITAVMLALLHGSRYRDAVERAAAAFEQPVDAIERRYEHELSHWMGHEAVEAKPDGAVVAPLDPASLAMPAQSVDLERWWLYRPLSMHLKLTDACQRTCRYCSVELDRSRDNIATERWLRLVEEGIDNGVVTISYLGGDPLLHRGLYELIRYAVGRGIQPFISTKCFVSEETAGKLVDAGLRRIQISIDSHVDPVADYLLDSRGAGKQLLASVENCIRAGMRVRTNSVITPYNVLLFPELVARLEQLGVYKMGTSACGYSLFADEIDSLLLREDEGTWLQDQVQAMRERGVPVSFSFVGHRFRRENFEKRAWCTAGVWNAIVNSDGALSFCDDLPNREPFAVGNVFETPLLDLWESEAANRLRVPERQLYEGTVCSDCELFERCSRHPRICFRDSYQAYGRVFGPPPQCPRAPEPPVRLGH